MVGRTLGHYRVLEHIGSGGMGVVYRARDERLERDVVLKMLPEGALADEQARRRFRREALALSQLNHPNIATVHDFNSQDGVDFLVLEHIEGETLDERLARGPLAEREVVKLGVQLAAGLEAAHKRGVVHRDLKPGNLRVTPDGRLKILDFGLARLLQPLSDRATLASLSETQTIVGTLPYMAPEQLGGDKADARSDLYAAGAVLYELATGRRAFPQDQAPQLMYAILNQAPEAPSTVHRHVTPGLEGAILKGLEKDLELRYQSARDLRVDLERLSTSAATVERSRTGRGAFLVRATAAAGLLALMMMVWALNPGGWRDRIISQAPGPTSSLAVLPLANLSGDPQQEYFADGMTDELITSLGKISALKVIARSSVMRYKGTRPPLRDIARALRVGVVLEGSVLSSGDRVRITVQLIQATTGKLLWSERYERSLRDVLALQNDVARTIAHEIQVQLTPQEQIRLAAASPVDPGAFQAYLKGRYALDKFTPEGSDQAEQLFRRAIEIDPAYARAWAGLADAYYFKSNIAMAPNVVMPKARAAAENALRLDESLSEAHASMGIVKMVFDWDWAGAEREFDRAIALRAGNANAHLQRGHLLVCLGRFEEGLMETRRAIDLDPLSAFSNAYLGLHLYLARRYDESLEHLQTALQADPKFYIYHVFLALVREQQGDHAQAVAALEEGVRLESNNDDLAQLAHAYGTAGRRQDAVRVIAQLLERRNRSFVPAANIALAYAGLGDEDEAFRWLEHGVEDHSEMMKILKVDPALDALRPDRRFDALLRRVSLTP